MIFKACTLAAAVAVMATPAVAQDLDTSQMSQHADTIRQGILVDKTVRRGYNGGGGYRTQSGLSARAEATCLNKRQAAVNLGRNHPKVQQLYALCAQAGL